MPRTAMGKKKKPKSLKEKKQASLIKKVKKDIDMSELGGSGNYFVAGQEIYEYQPELIGSLKFTEYDKMMRGSAMARATFKAIVLPLEGGRWIVSSDGKSRADRAQVEFVEHNLFTATTSSSWEKMLYEIFQCVAMGMYPTEKVWVHSQEWSRWRYGGNWILLKKLAPRHPSTVDQILFDDNGDLSGIRQSVYMNKKNSTEMKTVDIPIKKLAIFTHDQEGDNIEGVSIFRTGYGHWRQIKTFYNIAAIGAERMTLGYPVFEYPENYFDLSPQDRAFCKECYQTILKNFRAHQHSGAMIPPKAKLHIVKGDFNFIALERLISHHEMKIAQSALATFLKIGEAREGSRALSSDQSDFFLRSLQALGNNICGVINTFVIPEMIFNNFREVDNMPYLRVTNIGARNLKEYAETIQTLIQAKVLTVDEEGTLEDELRQVFDLPVRPDTQKDRLNKYLKYEEKKKDREHEVQTYYYDQFKLQQKRAEDPYEQNMLNNPEYRKYYKIPNEKAMPGPAGTAISPTNGGLQNPSNMLTPPPGTVDIKKGGDLFHNIFKTESPQPSRPYFKYDTKQFVPRNISV